MLDYQLSRILDMLLWLNQCLYILNILVYMSGKNFHLNIYHLGSNTFNL